MTTEPILPDDTLTLDAYISTLTIAVPPSTKWQPEVAEQLMVSLFKITPTIPLTLTIHAADGRVTWGIEVERDAVDVVRNTIYALYPQAVIAVSPKHTAPVGFYRFDFHGGNSYIAPITSASDFSKTDPLASVIGAMSTLDPTEELYYTVAFSRPTFDTFEFGQKLLTKSTINWTYLLHPTGWMFAAALKTTGADRREIYTSEIAKKVRAKLAQPLRDVDFRILVKTSTAERARTIVDGLLPAFAPFYLEGFNMPCPALPDTYPLVLSPQEVAALWHFPTELCQAPGIAWSSGSVSPLPLAIASQQDGIHLGENLYQGRIQPVRLPYPDRVTHVNLIGRTRVGKSTLLHNMAHQDIQNGKGVAVIDPHGDLVNAILAASIPLERMAEVVLFDTSDHEYPIGLNLLAAPPGVSLDAVAGQTLAVIRKLFADQWSATRMESVLDASLRALVTYQGATIQDITKLLLDATFRAQVLSSVTDPTTLEFWYDEFEHESDRQQREMARPITYRLRKFYRDPTIRQIVCQVDSLDFRTILNTQKIFLANLSGVSELDAETIGALLISKFQLASMSRASLTPEERTPFYLYIDEVQNFITTSLPKLFSEAGKYGISLVVANQFLTQLEGETLEAILGNVGTTIMFRVGQKDARVLSPSVKEHFTPEDLVNLDRFHTIVKMQVAGQTTPAFSMITTPPLPTPDDAHDRIYYIRDASRQTYARPAAAVEAELADRFRSAVPAGPTPAGDDDPEEWLDELAE